MTAMTTTAITYLLYLAISIALTIWVGRTLYKNGFLFLVDVFRGNEALAHSVNHLLVVGFYLVNFGFVSLHLRLQQDILDPRMTIEALADKVGVVLLVLGLMHSGNLYVFSRTRSRAPLGDAFPPVGPDGCTPVSAAA